MSAIFTPETAPMTRSGPLPYDLSPDGHSLTAAIDDIHQMYDGWHVQAHIQSMYRVYPKVHELFRIDRRQEHITLPTAEGFNNFFDKPEIKRLPVTDLKLAHLPGGELPVEVYFGHIAMEGLVPVTAKLYAHDITYHAFGIKAFSLNETTIVKAIIADAISWHKANPVTGKEYLTAVGAVFDTVSFDLSRRSRSPKLIPNMCRYIKLRSPNTYNRAVGIARDMGCVIKTDLGRSLELNGITNLQPEVAGIDAYYLQFKQLFAKRGLLRRS